MTFEKDTQRDTEPEFEFEFEHWLPPEVNPRVVFLLVVLQFFANFFLNIDMGILPAGSTTIKEEMELDNIKFGTLGSVVYFGQMIGSLMATWTFR